MTKVNKQGSHRPEAKRKAGSPKPAEAKKTTMGATSNDMMVTPKDNAPVNKGKQSARSNQTRVGGTAVPGAKSTQPKEITTTNPQQQQAESYNRNMRRRMQHLGTGPGQGSVQDQRQKRLEKRKRRVEERRQEVKKVAATGPRNISLGRRNTYFLIAVVVVIILVIVAAYLINHH